jgi:ABC-2 type transport system ATP-binding protein
MNDPILSLDQVVKTYGSKIAVNKVSFEVNRGNIFGLLGPNGAGKTSIIRIITGITRADEGLVRLDGQSLSSRFPAMIGYMPEERGLYKKMKVGEHLLYLARLKGLSKNDAKDRIGHWMQKFEIEDWWNKKVEELSKGMQQKIQFIATVVHQPKLLILDEPFSGLDPVNTNLIKDEIHQLQQEGVSIIFSTHRMEQVEEICEHIVLIDNGENVLEGAVDDIKEQFKRNHYFIKHSGEFPESLKQQLEILSHKNNELTFKAPEHLSSSELLKMLLTEGLDISAFQEILPTLNEIFIQQVQKN